jgi:thiol-disulfide isomerase/thioredoxin
MAADIGRKRQNVIERAVILFYILIAVVGLWQLWRYYQKKQLDRVANVGIPPELALRLPPGPTVLYFTGAHCAQCRLQQAPILSQLTATVNVNLHTVDATQDERLTSFFGVMTLPTTVILDKSHRPKAINHGLATLDRLRQQASELLVP